MASNNQTSNLSIIAVRLLSHCRESVRKCLRENIFYYLNTDFIITDDGTAISRRKGYVDTIDDTFFDSILSKDEQKSRNGDEAIPNINLSAIVGKNGDGKSSLVEFMLRLINNFAYCAGLNPYEHLVFVDGVYGELYYRLNGHLFKIRLYDQADWVNSTEIYKFTYNETEKIYKAGEALTSYDPETSIFYTLVSNYSHFAYNTEDFEEERYPRGEEDLWLHRLFHKNDGYQTPINLHPFREKGNIDINREKLLSTQRLLTVIVRNVIENMREKDNGVEINDKTPHLLRLTDVGFSKLQKVTLKEYFKGNRGRNILQEEVRRRYFSNGNRFESLKNLRKDVSPILMQIFKNYVLKAKKGFFKSG
ncbi:MAG: ATP-binding protein, partial [Allobaculum sp.]|nr:ATP-binding protein [Allobaculum sp.]